MHSSDFTKGKLFALVTGMLRRLSNDLDKIPTTGYVGLTLEIPGNKFTLQMLLGTGRKYL